jgi:hypothetical protein
MLHRPLVFLFLLGSLGTAAELLLLEHTEDVWQNAPLVLLGVGCVLAVVMAASPSELALRLFRVVMFGFVASGVIGVGLHFDSNLEFERELQPDAAGLGLVWESFKGATPALAPGTMLLLGGLGWFATSTSRR